MIVASWNVNSIRVRVEHVQRWLELQQPDILGLQELKMVTEDFPAEAFKAVGYEAVADGQKTYNGVALISRHAPEDICRGLPNYPDAQRRAIAASYGDLRVLNLYVPNGQSVDSEKFQYKLEWLDAVKDYVADEIAKHSKVLVMGDFNIAPEDRDVHDPEEWRDKVLCSKPERDRLQALVSLGLVDAFRLFDQAENSFSWWDYRAAAFRRKRGLRIDLILITTDLASQCTGCQIDTKPRQLDRPSDHAPVFATFET